MSSKQEVKANGDVKPGEEVLVSPEAMGSALKGQVWGIPNGAGVEYDGEFTGEHYQGNLIVKIKRKSEKQPKNNG